MSKKETQHYKIDIVITGNNLINHDVYIVDRFNKNVEIIEKAVEYINLLYPNIVREPIYITNENKEPINIGFKFMFSNVNDKTLIDNSIRIDWVTIKKIKEIEENITLEESQYLLE